MSSLITSHDYFNIHKFMGFGILAHYGYRFSLKLLYNDMFLKPDIFPLLHLGLSLSSFIFKVPKYRYLSRTIIWKELQLHNIIFTSRSVCMIYHSLFFNNNNDYKYYISRLFIIITHHYLADIVSTKYQNNELTTTRDIKYDNGNKYLIKINKYFYAISQLIATTTLLLSTNQDNGFSIMFPIQLSAFLMTLVRKGLITNNQWHYIYTTSLIIPYLINRNGLINNNNNNIKIFSLLHIFLRFGLNTNKYINMIIITSGYFVLKHFQVHLNIMLFR
jgi:hypothetical protein